VSSRRKASSTVSAGPLPNAVISCSSMAPIISPAPRPVRNRLSLSTVLFLPFGQLQDQHHFALVHPGLLGDVFHRFAGVMPGEQLGIPAPDAPSGNGDGPGLVSAARPVAGIGVAGSACGRRR